MNGRSRDRGAARWYTRPGVLLTAVGILVVAVALFSPDVAGGRTGDPRLTTYSAAPQGAELFYELAGRLGWKTERHLVPGVTDDPGTIHAVLAPPQPLRTVEVHALLDAVRRGGALLLVLSPGRTAFNDSLHVATGAGAVYVAPDSFETADCHGSSGVGIPFWPAGQVLLYSLRWTAPPPSERVTFARVSTPGPHPVSRPAAVGFSYGRGRIVVASDPDFLRNDALRVCRYGLSVAAVHALEYLSGGGPVERRRVSFDEYHQGFGSQPGTVSAIAEFFSGTPSGHLLLQLLAAGFVLLLAAAPRAIPPRDAVRVQRRSPLEHVDALGRAYDQVGATRTAVMRLVRGVRRRIGLAAGRATAGASDAQFLDWAERTDPAIAADTARVRLALQTAVSRHELSAVGDALTHIEASLTRFRT